MLSKKKPQDRVDPEYLVSLDTASAQPAPAGVKPFIKKHWKPITAAICAAAVAAAVLVPKNSAKPAAASAQYVETRPEKRNIVNSYSADGTITAADTYTVKPMVKGTVLTADFEVGDIVSKGDVLYTIDSSDVASSVEKAQSSYDDAVDAQYIRSSVRGTVSSLKVKAGDVLVGIASSGVHSNGFSLVRKIVADNCFDLHEVYPELSNKLLGEVLLTPTKIYVRQVLEVIRNCDVHGISHITGGGFDENIPRILHDGQGLEIDEGAWEILPVFRFLEKYGKVAHREMFNIFNMGIGMVIALDASEADKAIGILTAQGEKASVIGRVTDAEGVVIR